MRRDWQICDKDIEDAHREQKVKIAAVCLNPGDVMYILPFILTQFHSKFLIFLSENYYFDLDVGFVVFGRIFDSLVPHGTPANLSLARRRALQFHYIAPNTPRVPTEERLRLFGGEGRGNSVLVFVFFMMHPQTQTRKKNRKIDISNKKISFSSIMKVLYVKRMRESETFQQQREGIV